MKGAKDIQFIGTRPWMLSDTGGTGDVSTEEVVVTIEEKDVNYNEGRKALIPIEWCNLFLI